MKPFLLSSVDVEILEGLAAFRFLTVEQLLRLNPRDAANLQRRLRGLVAARLIDSTPKTRDPENEKGGTLPLLYWLTQSGANTLAEHGGLVVQPPRAKVGLASDVRHRAGVVDAHMALSRWAEDAGATVQWAKAYFENDPTRATKATPFVKATSIVHAGAQEIIPDLSAKILFKDGKSRGVVVEYERGGRDGRLDNFFTKLPLYLLFIENSAIKEAFKDISGERILFVFRKRAMLEKAIERWPTWPEGPKNLIYMKHEAELADFGTWWGLDGKRKVLVPDSALRSQ